MGNGLKGKGVGLGFGEKRFDGRVVGFVRDFVDELKVISQAEGGDRGVFFEEGVVVAFAVADAVAIAVEGDAGDEDEVQGAGVGRRPFVRDFQDAVMAFAQVVPLFEFHQLKFARSGDHRGHNNGLFPQIIEE